MKTPDIILTDTLFTTAFAQDLMIQDLMRRMAGIDEGMRQRSRFNFNELIKALKRASFFVDQLKEELFDAEAINKWKNVQTWQDEANEVARLVLLWADREPYPEVCNEIFKFIRSTKGQGVVDEKMLEQYYLKK